MVVKNGSVSDGWHSGVDGIQYSMDYLIILNTGIDIYSSLLTRSTTVAVIEKLNSALHLVRLKWPLLSSVVVVYIHSSSDWDHLIIIIMKK